MKKTMTLLLAAAALLAGVQASAQMSVGAGYLNLTQTSGDSSLDGNGAYAGVSYNIPLVGGLSVAPGVYYSFAAFKTGDVKFGTLFSSEGKWHEHAINIPLNLNYGMNFASDMRGFVFAGPTFQYGLSSKNKVNADTVIGSGSSTTDLYADGGYNRFIVYLGGGIGMDIANRFQLTVGYDHSLNNFYKDSDSKSGRGALKLGVAMLF